MTLAEFNSISPEQARDNLFRCCGCTSWVERLMKSFPFDSIDELKMKSDESWNQCDEGDWLEAFSHHPKIGQKPEAKHESTSEWASKEQSGVRSATDEIRKQLAEENSHYQKKFGFIFIVCATGKEASEMLGILKERIQNDRQKEIRIAAVEQNKITHLRIDKLFS